ncbi:Adenosine 3'-phospho 5'-phosphosulfate transporter 1 isoform 3 [Schistosoma japonicum]|uniref:Adenosine 3'-phospho 5'-phosphosulfate transporter 1 n=1 Tax=Schistosoma japonicum TaxID=6182 RepID=A0A4Z2DEN1_SCHJA|nr:Adenosine 3'-phospho 5'-phosphosulfate transporter 1 isoform 3 [Schistosoma japonicum]
MEKFLSTYSYFSWPLQLIATLSLYSGVILPFVLLSNYFRRRYKLHIFNGTTDSCSAKAMYICFVPDVDSLDAQNKINLPIPVVISTTQHRVYSKLTIFLDYVTSCLCLSRSSSPRTSKQYYILLLFCFFGLQCSYLIWGVLQFALMFFQQERIMTKTYDNEKFRKSQYLVFCNRVMALVILIPLHFLHLGLLVNPLKKGYKAPLIEFAYASISNVISSWCQYEALIYISFPTQVILKACKVLPVMFMGKFIQKKLYSWQEYFTATIICLGMVMFFYTNPEKPYVSEEKTNTQFLFSLSGYLLIIGYIVCDSFTSNWQDYMFQTYKLTSLQVMAGVNFWSVLLTLISLIGHNELISCILFGVNHPKFILDVLTSSLCSAFGQLFIFLTLSQFGAVTFVLIMTLRLGLSMILSCIIFSHELHPIAIFGVVVVFIGLFLKMFLRQKKSLSLEIHSTPGDCCK